MASEPSVFRRRPRTPHPHTAELMLSGRVPPPPITVSLASAEPLPKCQSSVVSPPRTHGTPHPKLQGDITFRHEGPLHFSLMGLPISTPGILPPLSLERLSLSPSSWFRPCRCDTPLPAPLASEQRRGEGHRAAESRLDQDTGGWREIQKGQNDTSL